VQPGLDAEKHTCPVYRRPRISGGEQPRAGVGEVQHHHQAKLADPGPSTSVPVLLMMSARYDTVREVGRVTLAVGAHAYPLSARCRVPRWGMES